MRTNFLNQISIPIMSVYLKNANQENQTLTYADIFKDTEPCQDLLDYFGRLSLSLSREVCHSGIDLFS